MPIAIIINYRHRQRFEPGSSNTKGLLLVEQDLEDCTDSSSVPGLAERVAR